MRTLLVGYLALALLAAGCEPLPKRGIVGAIQPDLAAAVVNHALTAAPNAPPAVPPKKRRVTSRKANTKGKILILEYHKLSGKNTLLDRTSASFKKDLERLYKLGYRPVTVTQWLDDKMDLAPGASPVIITFDDGHDSQLRFHKDGTLDKNSFVGLWKEFADAHPDFPVRGTFFVLPPFPFGQKHFVDAKMALLKEFGSEIASHTYHHKNLSIQSDETVKAEIATSLDFLKRWGVESTTVAFPYGNKPKNMKIMQGFEFKGKQYNVRASFLAAGEPAEPLGSAKLNIFAIPRVVACENEGGSSYWLTLMTKSKHIKPYVAP